MHVCLYEGADSLLGFRAPLYTPFDGLKGVAAMEHARCSMRPPSSPIRWSTTAQAFFFFFFFRHEEKLDLRTLHFFRQLTIKLPPGIYMPQAQKIKIEEMGRTTERLWGTRPKAITRNKMHWDLLELAHNSTVLKGLSFNGSELCQATWLISFG